MFRRLLFLTLALLLGLPSVGAVARQGTPEAPASDGAGPVAITGSVSVVNFEDSVIYSEPTVALLDITEDLPIETPDFAPVSGQILGYQTAPLFGNDPGTYRVDLPVLPGGETMDLDGDGEGDGGVQAFQLIIASNIIGDSYLYQVEQTGGRRSILRDVSTGHFLEGSLLIYAVDDNQSFQTHWGTDGLWFTKDDEFSSIEQGYSVITLAPDGTSSIDRSATPAMDALASVAAASPNYSDQGILESYNSLLDRLNERYSYTDLRQIEWEQVRATYLTRVEEADANQDFAAYYQVLTELTSSIEDAHVQVAPWTEEAIPAYSAQVAIINQQLGGTVGASTAALSDPENPNGPIENIVIVTVGDGGPAADAGIVPGTEIVSVNGQTVAERLASIPDWYLGTFSQDEKRLAHKSQLLLRVPDGTEVTLEYRLPGETEVKSATLVAGQYPIGNASAPAQAESISFKLVDGYTVIRWGEFEEDFLAKIAVLEEALKFHQDQSAQGNSQGIILDVRGNSGGWDLLYMAMASYFYTPENPQPRNVFDIYEYDDATQRLQKEYHPNYEFFSPNPAITYTGPLAVIIDETCASSCEFFSQTLQRTGRATIYGQYASEGAGGNVDRVMMPGGILVQYTVGQSRYAGTDEFNIEAKGVIPDVRLPITLETQQALYTGETDYTVALTILAIEATAPSAASPEAVEATPAS